MLKEIIRRIMWMLPWDEYAASPGTIKFQFLDWLYGNGVPEFDVIWPEEKEQ